jgi:hypothetical protein
MDQADIERIIIGAVDTLFAEDLEIIRRDVSERTICAQLRAILQRYFDRHAVHAEYNRHGIEPKEIELPDADGVPTIHRVSPDIIVHQAGHDRQNILVVEVKKTTNPNTDKADLIKLAEIKRRMGYRFAVFLRLPAGAAADARNVHIQWVEP